MFIKNVPKCASDFLDKKYEAYKKKKEISPDIPFSVYFQEEMKKGDNQCNTDFSLAMRK